MNLGENHMRPHVYRHRAICAWAIVLGLVVLLTAGHASAQPVDIPASWGGDVWSRPRLTGSWGRLRDELGKKGVVLVDIDLLQTLQGVASGGPDEVARYFGLAEYTLNVETQKLGLWPGGFLRVQGMSGFGDSVDSASRAFIPPSLVSLLPLPGETTTGLMNLTFMQFLSPHFAVVAGKMSGLGADENAFAHDYHTTFVNAALDFNMAAALFPLSAFGGGIVVLPWEGAVVTAAALDPDGTATNNDLGEAFKDGVLVAAEGRIIITPFGLVGHQLLGVGGAIKSACRSARIVQPCAPAPDLAVSAPGQSWDLPRALPGAVLPVPARAGPTAQSGALHVDRLL